MASNSVASFAVDAMWGKACAAYHLQFRPEDEVIAELVRIQDEVEARFDRLYRVPPHALHMTVQTLLLPTTDVATVDQAWTRVGARCIEIASAQCASCEPIPVAWTTVRAFDKAIVLMGDAPTGLQTFRANVIAAAAEAGLRLPPLQIAHVSLFRYAGIDPRLPGFEQPCGPFLSFMQEMRLVREDRYPSIELEVLDRWRLAGGVVP